MRECCLDLAVYSMTDPFLWNEQGKLVYLYRRVAEGQIRSEAEET
jgi:hypothetical protein